MITDKQKELILDLLDLAEAKGRIMARVDEFIIMREDAEFALTSLQEVSQNIWEKLDV